MTDDELEQLTDAELMQRVIDDDWTAYTMLVRRFQRPIVNYIYTLVRDRHMAEDMAQDVFMKLYKNRHQYEPRGNFKTYLYRIAKNHWIDKCRRDGRRPQELSLNRQTDGDDSPAFIDQVVDLAYTPQTFMHKSELMESIEAAIDALPDEQQMVFNLSEYQGLKYQEIATVLDIPVGTVKSRMHLAVRKLQGFLQSVRRRRQGGE